MLKGKRIKMFDTIVAILGAMWLKDSMLCIFCSQAQQRYQHDAHGEARQVITCPLGSCLPIAVRFIL